MRKIEVLKMRRKKKLRLSDLIKKFLQKDYMFSCLDFKAIEDNIS